MGAGKHPSENERFWGREVRATPNRCRVRPSGAVSPSKETLSSPSPPPGGSVCEGLSQVVWDLTILPASVTH